MNVWAPQRNTIIEPSLNQLLFMPFAHICFYSFDHRSTLTYHWSLSHNSKNVWTLRRNTQAFRRRPKERPRSWRGYGPCWWLPNQRWANMKRGQHRMNKFAYQSWVRAAWWSNELGRWQSSRCCRFICSRTVISKTLNPCQLKGEYHKKLKFFFFYCLEWSFFETLSSAVDSVVESV